MTELIESRPSPIHGTGVFALAFIAEGTMIARYTGTPTEVDGTHVLWIEQDDGELLGVDGTSVLRFLNHGETPNVEFDGAELYALRALRADEELLFDYGEEWAGIL